MWVVPLKFVSLNNRYFLDWLSLEPILLVQLNKLAHCLLLHRLKKDVFVLTKVSLMSYLFGKFWFFAHISNQMHCIHALGQKPALLCLFSISSHIACTQINRKKIYTYQIIKTNFACKHHILSAECSKMSCQITRASEPSYYSIF